MSDKLDLVVTLIRGMDDKSDAVREQVAGINARCVTTHSNLDRRCANHGNRLREVEQAQGAATVERERATTWAKATWWTVAKVAALLVGGLAAGATVMKLLGD